MERREDSSLDDVDRALDLAFGPPTWTEGGGVLPRIEQSTGLRLRTSLLPIGDDGGRLEDESPAEEAVTGEDTQFEFIGELARGGVGIVYHGRDRDLRREVAIKILKPELARRREVLVRFVEEAQVCGQLAHPGIVPVYGLALLGDGQVSIAMKLVRGVTLGDVLDSVLDLVAELPRLLGLFEQLASTVGYAHARRVIHRDLKPANVMVGAFGELQVMDWGFAKVLGRDDGETESPGPEVVTVRSRSDEAQSMVGSIMGTPGYMPPEQARGRVTSLDERADVFALGSILCRILTGEPVYAGEPTERLRKAIGGRTEEAVERLDASTADTPLVDLAKRCIAVEPRDRPRDAAAVADAVRTYREAVQERAEEAELERARARAREAEEQQRARWERRTRRQSRTLGTAVAVVVLAGLGTWLWIRAEAGRRVESAVASAEVALDNADERALAGDLVAALGAARRAAEQLAGHPDHPTRLRALEAERRLRERQDRESAARRLTAEDATIRRRLAAVPRVGAPGIDPPARGAALHRALLDSGFDVNTGVDAAAWLRARGPETREALLAALHGWAVVSDRGDATRLLEVADAADPDAQRQALRTAYATSEDEALVEAARAVADTSDAPTLTLELTGLLLGSTADKPPVIAVLRRLRDRHPRSTEVQLALAQKLQGKDPRSRMEAWRSRYAAVTIDPTLDDVWVALGEMKQAQGRTDEAEALWQAGTRHRPRTDRAHLRLARHLVETGRPRDAFALLTERLAWHERAEGWDGGSHARALEHWLTAPAWAPLRAEELGADWHRLWVRVRTTHQRLKREGDR